MTPPGPKTRARIILRSSAPALFVAISALASTSFANPSAPSPFASFGDVTSAKLPNGTRVWVQEDHRAPLIGLASCFEVGEVDDPVDERGLTQVAGRLLELGQTPHLTESARRDMSVALGGLLPHAKVTVTAERTCLHLVVPASSLELALYAERDRAAFVAAGLTAQRLTETLSVVAKEAPNATTPGAVIGRLRAGVYEAGHPLTRLTVTDGSALGAVGVEEVRQALQTWFGGGPSDVAIVGDVSTARAVELVTKLFGDLAGPVVRPPLGPPRVALTGERRIAVDADVVRTEVAMGWPTPKQNDDDDLALDVAVRVLALRFGDHLKDRDGLAIHYRLSEGSLPEASLFSISLTPAPHESEERCLRAADAELAALGAQAPASDELVAAKQMVLGNIANMLDGDGARAATILQSLHSTGDPRGYIKYAERYQAVSADDVSRAVAKYLSSTRRAVLIVHPDPKAPKVGRLHDDARERSGPGPQTRPNAAPARDAPPLATLAPPFLEASTQDFVPPRPIDLVRRDGTRVELVAQHELPTVSVGVSLRWRKPFVALSVNGFMSTVLLAAKGPGSEDSLDDVLRKAGATFTSESGVDGALFTFSVHPAKLESVLPRILAILAAPRISQSALDLARAPFAGQAAHWKPAVKDTMRARHLLSPAGHRYSLDVDGGEAQLRDLTLAQLSGYLAKELHGESVSLAVVGDVDANRLAQILGARKATPAPFAADAPVVWRAGTSLVPRPGATGVTIIASFPEPPSGSAAAVAAHGLESLAFAFFNDQLITHRVVDWSDFSTSRWDLRDGALFNFVIHLKKKGAAVPFVKAILDAVAPLRRESTGATLARVRSTERFEMAKAYDSQRDAVRRLIWFANLGLSPDADLRLRERLNGLSSRQIVDVANQFFRPSDLRLVLVGDVGGLEDGLSTLPIAPAKVVSETAGDLP